MKRICPKCPYSALCVAHGFDDIFNALALQHAKQWLAAPEMTNDLTRIRRSARLVVRAVQEVMPIGCPEMQRGQLRSVLMGLNGCGPVVDMVVESPF